MNRPKIERRFTYHAPTHGQVSWLEICRMHHTNLALWIEEFCPESPEKEQALNKLDECLFWANASIVRGP